MATLGRMLLELGINSKELIGGLAVADSAVGKFEKSASGSMAGVGAAVAGLAVVGTLGAVAGATLKAAGDFQSSITQLITGAGELEGNRKMVSEGILKMAGDVGTSALELSNSLYKIEPAGFHGAEALTVLKAAAEGAKVGAADLDTVGGALTTTLAAYSLKAAQAVPVTNQMIAAVAAGKMHMGEFAGSLSAVLPFAAAAKISIAEVFGAVATMTGQGMSAQQATQDLANTIHQLQKPSSIAVKEMAQLGLSSNDVAQQLGQKGLSGTLEVLTVAITKHMGPAGTVLINSFNQSKAAAADADTMLTRLPKSIQGIAHQFQAGTITAKEWRADLKNLSPEAKNLAQEFAKTQLSAHGFNDLLKSGSPQAQTYNAALSDMLGGTTGLNTALMLTGPHMETFKANVAGVDDAAVKGGKSITGWSLVQDDFNQKMDRFKAGAGSAAIELGTKLLPAAGKLADVLTAGLPKVLPALQFTLGALKTLSPLIAAVVTGWVAWNVALAVQKGMAIASLILQFAGGLTTMVAHAGLATTAQWLLNAAMDANPVGVIVVGIAALVGVLILAYQHVKPFRDAVNWLWQEIVQLWHWIVGGSPGLIPAFQQLMGIVGTVMRIAVTPLRMEFALLSTIVSTVWNTFQGFASFLGGAFAGALSGISGVIGKVGSALSALNPLAKHSPSLVENVGTGVDQIIKHYGRVSNVRLRVGAQMSSAGGGGLPGAGGGASGGRGIHVENIVIHNPRPEAASTSTARELTKLSYLGQAS